MKRLLPLAFVVLPILVKSQCKDVYNTSVDCPTQADSLVLYNNAVKVYEFYENNKSYTKSNSTELITNDQKKTVFELLHDARKMFFLIRKTIASSKPDPRFPDIKPKEGYKDITYKDYYNVIDEYRFYQKELENQIVNSDAPAPLYDSRIGPILINEYKNLDSSSIYFGDLVNIPLYIPVVVKPFALLTEKELELRNEILHIIPKIVPKPEIEINVVKIEKRFEVKRDNILPEIVKNDTVQNIPGNYLDGTPVYIYNEYNSGAIVGYLYRRRLRKIRPEEYSRYAIPKWAKSIIENEKELEKLMRIRFGEYYIDSY